MIRRASFCSPGGRRAPTPEDEKGAVDRSGRDEDRSPSIESVSGGCRWRALAPYALFHREGAWYLVGHCHVNGEPRTFRLDRVEDARLAEGSFTRPADFDLERYLERAWSVVRGREDHRVALRFPEELGPLVENARHHPGEEVEPAADEEGWIEYRVRLSTLDEIARWIVGFGGRVRVVEPEELRQKVRELAEGELRG